MTISEEFKEKLDALLKEYPTVRLEVSYNIQINEVTVEPVADSTKAE